MKKTIYLLGLILLIVVAVSCGGQSENSQEGNTNENIETEVPEIEKSKFVSEKHTIKARFIMQSLSTDGVIFSVEDDKGNDYYFWDRNPDVKGIRFLNKYPENEPLDELENTWFELIYENRMCEFYDGSTGEYFEREELVILQVVPWEERMELQKCLSVETLSPEIVSTLNLYGTEPFWSLYLYEDYVMYNDPEVKNKKMYYLVKFDDDMGFANVNDALETQKDGSVSLRIQAEGSSEYIRLDIAREDCNDGMSDEEFRFSVVCNSSNKSHFEGCGKIRSK